MTVLHLLGSPGEGGAETYFTDLVRALQADLGEQAAAIRPNAGREAALRDAGVAMQTAPFGGPIDLRTRARLAAFARQVETRVLVQWMNRAGRFAPKGPWARVGRLGGYYSLKYYRGCDRLVANTADIAAWIVREGWPADRVDYVPNFAEATLAPAASRAAESTPEDAPLLVALGRLHPSKAHDVALRALARLPQAWLWIAGEGPLEAELRALANQLGVAERVRFLGWRDDASALYRAADVCLFPSRFEPLGNVVIQAWAHGAPLVAAAATGPAALIRDGEDALLAPVDNDAALAAAVRRLFDDPALAARLAEAGRARVAAEFSRAAVVERWRELFHRFGEG